MKGCCTELAKSGRLKYLLAKEKTEEITQYKRGRMEILVYLLENLGDLKQIDSLQILGLDTSELALYMHFLLAWEFIKNSRYENKMGNYEITGKGKDFLREYGKLKSILEKELR